MRLRLDTTARAIDIASRALHLAGAAEDAIPYDRLVIGTGAVPVRPPIGGLDALGPGDGVHLLHSMDDTFAVMRTLEETGAGSAVIVGAGYVGLEMAEALSMRGLAVTQLERLPEVLPTVDRELGALVRTQLVGHGVTVRTGTEVKAIARTGPGASERLRVDAVAAGGQPVTVHAGLVLVVTGVRPETGLAVSAGALTGRGDRQADRRRRRRDLQRDDRGRGQRSRPVLHPAAWLPVGRRPVGRPGVDPRPESRTRPSYVPAGGPGYTPAGRRDPRARRPAVIAAGPPR
jgi:NADPH-dependent 2,4-dienoyl-CoA reductase/sulfur reductase-like enzyme